MDGQIFTSSVSFTSNHRRNTTARGIQLITSDLHEWPFGSHDAVIRLFSSLQNRFGDSLGEDVWEACNAVFDRMPLAAVIDRDIFCVHGGIPRPLEDSTSRIQVGFSGLVIPQGALQALISRWGCEGLAQSVPSLPGTYM